MDEYKSKRIKRYLISLFWYIIAWTLAIAELEFIAFFALDGSGFQRLDAQEIFSLWFIFGLPIGFLDWLSNIILEREYFRKKSLLFNGCCKFVYILVGAVCILFINKSLNMILSQKHETLFIASMFNDILSVDAVVMILYLCIVSIFFAFARQIAHMIGPRILFNLLLGRYHTPKEEERIFMFLDLKSSTVWAEKLGDLKFSQLIQDCFFDLTNTAILHDVEIYQYVGDEAILTWQISKKMNDNCIKTFYHFKATLKEKESYYTSKYGALPEFKAGAHIGNVIVTEIGVIKRDISYLSDVLNTASRIQELCNKYEEEMLVSGTLKDMLADCCSFTFNLIGNISLRGKEYPVEVYSVDCKKCK